MTTATASPDLWTPLFDLFQRECEAHGYGRIRHSVTYASPDTYLGMIGCLPYNRMSIEVVCSHPDWDTKGFSIETDFGELMVIEDANLDPGVVETWEEDADREHGQPLLKVSHRVRS